VEDGRRIHVTFGRGNFFDSHAAITITNTALLKENRFNGPTGSDRPVAVSAGDGTSTLLAIDTLDSVPSAGFATERMDARRGRLAGVTALSYAAVYCPHCIKNRLQCLLPRNVGARKCVLFWMPLKMNLFKFSHLRFTGRAGNRFRQSVDVLIGEEIFAAPAYLKAGSTYAASLLAEDALRWLLIVAIILGAALISWECQYYEDASDHPGCHTMRLIVLLAYLLPVAPVQNVSRLIINWAVSISGVAMLVAIASLLSAHWLKIRQKKMADRYSILVFFGFLLTFLIGLVLGGPGNTDYQNVVTHILFPVEAGLLGALAIGLVVSAFRLYRANRGWMSVVFGISPSCFCY
jgi:hypothetical protein